MERVLARRRRNGVLRLLKQVITRKPTDERLLISDIFEGERTRTDRPDFGTVREAARDVLKKMSELEASLDVPGLVAKLTEGLQAKYIAALAKPYQVPKVPDPK